MSSPYKLHYAGTVLELRDFTAARSLLSQIDQVVAANAGARLRVETTDGPALIRVTPTTPIAISGFTADEVNQL